MASDGIATVIYLSKNFVRAGRAWNWRCENTHHGALNFYPIFIPLFEAKVSGVSVQDMLFCLSFLTPET